MRKHFIKYRYLFTYLVIETFWMATINNSFYSDSFECQKYVFSFKSCSIFSGMNHHENCSELWFTFDRNLKETIRVPAMRNAKSLDACRHFSLSTHKIVTAENKTVSGTNGLDRARVGRCWDSISLLLPSGKNELIMTQRCSACRRKSKVRPAWYNRNFHSRGWWGSTYGTHRSSCHDDSLTVPVLA